MDHPRCQTCNLWDKATPADDARLAVPMDERGRAGQCRLFPPFYVTLSDDRCAQHSDLRTPPKPQPVAAMPPPKQEKRGK